MIVFLIGYRGTGKSAVAQLLATRLGLASFDADAEIERLAGKSIAEIFAEQGEPAFRDLEAQVIAELAARTNVVVALGGGAVLREENRAQISGRGHIVWLKATAETIEQRILADPYTSERRPQLTPTGGLSEIQSLLAAREPIYSSLATLAVDTEGKTAAQVADEIAQAISG